jgi:hypothetical protein
MRRLERRKLSLFWLVFLIVLALIILSTCIAFGIVKQRLTEYESSQQKYAAAELFSAYFQDPNFDSLLDLSGYELSFGETRDNAIGYFESLTLHGLEFFKAASQDNLYVLQSGDSIVGTFTLVESSTTKHGYPIYVPGAITLIRNSRPVLPTPSPTPIPTPSPSPTPSQVPTETPSVVDDMQELRAFALSALQSYYSLSRMVVTEAAQKKTLAFYEAGSEMYKWIEALSSGPSKVYDSAAFENETVSDIVEIGENTFCCQVTYFFRMKRSGSVDFVEKVDFILSLRKNAQGEYRIYEQIPADTGLPGR